jgi:NAD(P)-dependent dehydrogenase (short-subunit alcohol dehydrogenase family)
LEIKNKVIVVTGGAGGIGLAIAKEFLNHYPKIIILADISFENINYTNEKIINKKCDISNETQINSLIDKVNKEFGLIDIFCSNAGILTLGD